MVRLTKDDWDNVSGSIYWVELNIRRRGYAWNYTPIDELRKTTPIIDDVMTFVENNASGWWYVENDNKTVTLVFELEADQTLLYFRFGDHEI